VIHAELSEPAAATGVAEGAEDETLGAAIERHLQRLFAEYGDALPPPGLYERLLKELERPLISMSLGATRGNQIKAAQLLGLNRNTLRKKIRDLDIQVVRGIR
jgi:two-component system nitrogen regulation response regulator GlnG